MKYIKLFENFSLNEAQRKLSSSFIEKGNSIVNSIYNDNRLEYIIYMAKAISHIGPEEGGNIELGNIADALKDEFPGIDVWETEYLNTGLYIPFYGSLGSSGGFLHHVSLVTYVINKLKVGKSVFDKQSKTLFGSKTLFNDLTKICEEELSYIKDKNIVYNIKNTDRTNYSITLKSSNNDPMKQYFRYDDVKYDILQFLDILESKGFNINYLDFKCHTFVELIDGDAFGYHGQSKKKYKKDELNDDVENPTGKIDLYGNRIILQLDIFLTKK